MVVNKDACFYYVPALDVTPSIIAEMDKNYAADSKKQATAEAPEAEQKMETKK